jgi:hypothetical protein
MRNLLILLGIATILCSAVVFAQLPDETNGRVPELDAFHKPIYALWHKAWPEKDIAQLKQLLPDVQAAYAKLAAAKLPGILRDTQGMWDEKLKILSEAMEAYKTTTAANDSVGILKATENVHMFYEGMVRIVRPVVKQLDDFHQVLYLVHHYYMPEYNLAKLKESADSLALKMDSLKTATLPKRHEAKAERFDKTRQGLAQSVADFVKAAKAGKDKEALAKLEETMHARYQMVEKIFE